MGSEMCIRDRFNMLATARTQRTWRRAVTDRFLDVPLAFHQRRPAGQLLAHADADVEVATTMLKPLAFSLSVIVLAVASLVSLLMVHVLFAAVAVVMFPTLTLLNRRFTRMVEAPAAEGQEAVGVLSGIAHESLDGALVVKTLGREADDECDRDTAKGDSAIEDAALLLHDVFVEVSFGSVHHQVGDLNIVDRLHGLASGMAEHRAGCLLYTSTSQRDGLLSRMPSSA